MFFTSNTQVVVLLGGLGTRLKSVTQHTPKPMVDIHGKPFFQYQLELLQWYGFREFIFCVGYKGSIIEDYFKDGSDFGVHITYSYDGDTLLGTGGALVKALPCLQEDFLLIYGDSYMDVNYDEILYHYYKQKSSSGISGLMTVFKNNNQFDKSNVVFKENKLLQYDKKVTSPDMEYIDYGISVLNKSVLSSLPSDQYVDLADIITKAVDHQMIFGYEVQNRFYEIGTPSSLNEFKSYIYNRLFCPRPAIFLDRDGTINEIVFNEDIEALDSPLDAAQLRLLPKTLEALKHLTELGYPLFIATNQPAAAKGKVSLGKLYEVNNHLREILHAHHIHIEDIFMCPHFAHPTSRTREDFLISDCDCRKPKPGLIKKALGKYNIDIENSYMVGDSYVDILAGSALNMKTVFLGKYKCDTCQLLGDIKPTLVFKSLYDFATHLCTAADKAKGSQA